jgi:2-iminobutanoate/2-iminopropanoate deaminase
MKDAMNKRQIMTTTAPRPGGAYSQGLVLDDYVWVASQGPYDPVTRIIVGTTIEEQTAQSLENVKAILEAAGATMADVVKVTVHLSDVNLFARFDLVYSRYFTDPKPVRTTIGSQLFGAFVMIDAVAYIGED